MLASYYMDTFTYDLRLAIFAVGCLCVGSLIIFGFVMVAAMWPGRNESWKYKRPIGVGRLPQDESVKIVDTPFDQDEWEDRLRDYHTR